MIVRVNLLPESYRSARRRALWFQRAVALGAVALACELAVGLVLYISAGQKRELETAAGEARHLVQSHQQELHDLAARADQIKKHVELSRDLRGTHHWSRLLGTLARAAPEGVVLSTVATEPARWVPAPPPPAPTTARGPGTAGPPPAVVTTIMKGVTIRGFAADHQGLSSFMTALNASTLFSGIDLQRMQREPREGRETIVFELQGQW